MYVIVSPGTATTGRSLFGNSTIPVVPVFVVTAPGVRTLDGSAAAGALIWAGVTLVSMLSAGKYVPVVLSWLVNPS